MSLVDGGELVLVRGDGAFVWDDQGRRYLDVPASLWYCNVGHGREEIVDAVAAQMRELEAYSTFGPFATRPTLELADRVSALAPVANAKVFFTSGGSDAIETAAKLARRYWHVVGRPDKRLFVSRQDAYHGLHALGTSIAGIEANREGYGTLVGETLRVARDDASALEALVEEVGSERIAAFFCEPVIGGGGVHAPAEGYLQEVQRICRAHDIVFVVDEVITGFGRTGALFASQRFGLEPDILVVAKGITSGYLPLGAAIVGERLWEPFWTPSPAPIFRHGLTYSGHASACAAALANLDILERERLVERVASLEDVLAAELKALEALPSVAEVRAGVGLLAAIRFETQATASAVIASCMEAGFIMRPIGDGATLQISPPFVVTEQDIERLRDAVEAAAAEAAAAEPGRGLEARAGT
jgi:putrescine---pyruvate transaminase